MVHAGRAPVNRARARFVLRSGSAASKGGSAAPPSTRQFLIGRAAIKNARNSPESHALYFSDRPIKRPLAIYFASRKSSITTSDHRSRAARVANPLARAGLPNPPHTPTLIATRRKLEIELTHSQETKKHLPIATFYGSFAPTSNSVTRLSIAESSAVAAKYRSQFTSGKPMRVAWAGSCSRSSVASRPGNSVRASKTTRCSGSCQWCLRSCARMTVRLAARAAGSSMRDDWLLADGPLKCAATKPKSEQSARRILVSRSSTREQNTAGELRWEPPESGTEVYAALETTGRTKSMRSMATATPKTGVTSPGSSVLRRVLALARTRTDVPRSRSAGSENVSSRPVPEAMATSEWKKIPVRETSRNCPV
jgi:hypothetical protein